MRLSIWRPQFIYVCVKRKLQRIKKCFCWTARMAVYDKSSMSQTITLPLVVAIIAAAIGSSFQFGLALGSLNAPERFIKQWINETYYERYHTYMDATPLGFLWASIISIFALGGALGGILTSVVSQSMGRRNGLLLNNLTAIVAAILMGSVKFTGIYELLLVARLLIGFNSGLNSGLAPMYLTEISPKEIRGAVGTIFQLFVTIGILVGQILGLESLLGGDRWWMLLAFPLIPAACQYMLLPLSPKSPKFLYLDRGDRAAAQKALQRLRRTNNVDDELRELEIEADQKRSEPQVSWRELFSNPFLRSVLFIAVMMMVAQQFSGINAAIFYSSSIFMNAGLTEGNAVAATIGMGAVNVAMTFVSMIIVDRAGRRALLLTGYTGMCIMTVVLTLSTLFSYAYDWVAYMAIVGVILFVVSFATGPGSIPWFLVTELFTSNARSKATTAAVVTNWVCTTIVGLSFPLLVNVLKEYTFLIFTGLLIFFIFYIYRYVPETRGKNSDEIQRELQARYGSPNYRNGGGASSSPMKDMEGGSANNAAGTQSAEKLLTTKTTDDVENRNIYYPPTANMINNA